MTRSQGGAGLNKVGAGVPPAVLPGVRRLGSHLTNLLETAPTRRTIDADGRATRLRPVHTGERTTCKAFIHLFTAALVPFLSCTNPQSHSVPPPDDQPLHAPAPAPPQPPPTPAPTVLPSPPEPFPGIRVDAASRLVEFDGVIPIDAHDPETPLVYLEVAVCTADTKEHESLVVTRVRPAHVHAALLLIGLTPGKPGSWTWDGAHLRAVDPTGDKARITFVYKDDAGNEVEADATDWITVEGNGQDPAIPSEWVFAGSRFVVRTTPARGGEPAQQQEVYDADGAGTLIGLATFGSETLAWPRTYSPDTEVQEPLWTARPDRIPKVGTPVTVRIRPAALR